MTEWVATDLRVTSLQEHHEGTGDQLELADLMAVDLDDPHRRSDRSLPNPVMTASGTSGHGDELGHYFPLSELGAVVVKSLAAFEWPGNPAPRLHPVTGGMLNSVGLQGPGVAAWLARRPAPTRARRAPGWSRASGAATVDDYAARGEDAASTRRPCVVAVEVNLSCPNLDGGAHLFAHSPEATAEALARRGDLRPAASGRSSARTPTGSSRSPRGRAGRGRRRRHARQHGDGHGHRLETGRSRARSGWRRAVRAAPSIRSRCGPSTTSAPRCPTSRSSGVGGVATGSRRGGADDGGRVRGPGRARRPSRTRRLRVACCTG